MDKKEKQKPGACFIKSTSSSNLFYQCYNIWKSQLTSPEFLIDEGKTMLHLIFDLN